MRTIPFFLVVILLLSGCMGEREYMLRKEQQANQAAHPPTFDVATFTGPLKIELDNGAEIKVLAPNQPFESVPVPDGAAYQRAVIRDVVTGAVLGYGLYRAGGGSTTRNSHNTTTAAP